MSSRLCLRLFIVGGVSFLSFSSSRCRRRRLVVVAVLLVLAAASLLVANYVGFCASLSLSPLAYRRCCRCLRLVIVVGVSLALTASFCCSHHRLFVVVVGVLSLALASRHFRCTTHVRGGVPPCGCLTHIQRLVVLVVVSVSLLLLSRSCSR